MPEVGGEGPGVHAPVDQLETGRVPQQVRDRRERVCQPLFAAVVPAAAGHWAPVVPVVERRSASGVLRLSLSIGRSFAVYYKLSSAISLSDKNWLIPRLRKKTSQREDGGFVMRIRTFVTTALVFCWVSGVVAAVNKEIPGKCQLTVDGHAYINGRCKIRMYKWPAPAIYHGLYGPGSFDIVSGKHMATVVVGAGAGIATGSWNGPEGASDVTQDDLGNLVHQGECWVNDRAKVCASR
jgi:hypothetical protein